MEHVELLRVRRGLIVFAAACLCFFLVVTLALHGHGGFHINIGLDKSGTSLGDFIGGAALGTMVLATFFAGHLAAETPTLSLLWTKPVSRAALAWRYVAIDALALVAGTAIGTVTLLALVAGLGQADRVRLDAEVLPACALSVGAPLAWYGLCLLAASRFDRDAANAVIALSWPVFIVVYMLPIIALPPAAHAVAVVVNHLDPLSYVLASSHPDLGLVAAPTGARAAVVWAIGVVSIAVATRLWTTREG
jgi:hypothetical protein